MRRMTEARAGKIPTTAVRRLILVQALEWTCRADLPAVGLAERHVGEQVRPRGGTAGCCAARRSVSLSSMFRASPVCIQAILWSLNASAGSCGAGSASAALETSDRRVLRPAPRAQVVQATTALG